MGLSRRPPYDADEKHGAPQAIGLLTARFTVRIRALNCPQANEHRLMATLMAFDLARRERGSGAIVLWESDGPSPELSQRPAWSCRHPPTDNRDQSARGDQRHRGSGVGDSHYERGHKGTGGDHRGCIRKLFHPPGFDALSNSNGWLKRRTGWGSCLLCIARRVIAARTREAPAARCCRRLGTGVVSALAIARPLVGSVLSSRLDEDDDE